MTLGQTFSRTALPLVKKKISSRNHDLAYNASQIWADPKFQLQLNMF